MSKRNIKEMELSVADDSPTGNFRPIGRFITQDPAADGDNWYEYVSNNPLGGTDTDGLWQAAGKTGKASKPKPAPKPPSYWPEPHPFSAPQYLPPAAARNTSALP